jgi:hypothetical protein
MTKGQTAMVGAMGFSNIGETPTTGKGGRPDQGVLRTAKASGVSHGTMTKAFLVKDYAADLAHQVINSGMTLDAAHEQAKVRKQQAEWRDDGLSKLRHARPFRRLLDDAGVVSGGDDGHVGYL